MHVLGHKNMNYFVNYNAVQLERYTERHGVFPVDITAREKRERLSLRERKELEKKAVAALEL